VAPAQQRFTARHALRAKPNNGLIVQLELVLAERTLEIALELALSLYLAASAAAEQLEVAPPRRFDAVEGNIGALQELVGLLPCAGAVTMPMLALIEIALPRMP
jgi:hypothetical protein